MTWPPSHSLSVRAATSIKGHPGPQAHANIYLPIQTAFLRKTPSFKQRSSGSQERNKPWVTFLLVEESYTHTHTHTAHTHCLSLSETLNQGQDIPPRSDISSPPHHSQHLVFWHLLCLRPDLGTGPSIDTSILRFGLKSQTLALCV